jgi:Zn-dependent protease
VPPGISVLCQNCGSALSADELKCHSCGRLTHANDFEALSQHARLAGQAGDWNGARAAWQRALTVLPPDSPEYQTVKGRIESIDLQLAPKAGMGKWLARLGPVGIIIWKFKTIALLFLTKFKLLLLGLTKIKTLLSMMAFFGVYWAMYGWKFALGFVLSIYVHEMGHVFALRRYGIAMATGSPIWYAIAHTGAWINLFNLIPIWQLDGGRGFRALTRKQRGMVLGVALAIWVVSFQMMFLLIAAGATYRLFSKDYAVEDDNVVLTQYIGLLVLLSLLVAMSTPYQPGL